LRKANLNLKKSLKNSPSVIIEVYPVPSAIYTQEQR
jgi:hypothetical protein